MDDSRLTKPGEVTESVFRCPAPRAESVRGCASRFGPALCDGQMSSRNPSRPPLLPRGHDPAGRIEGNGSSHRITMALSWRVGKFPDMSKFTLGASAHGPGRADLRGRLFPPRRLRMAPMKFIRSPGRQTGRFVLPKGAVRGRKSSPRAARVAGTPIDSGEQVMNFAAFL